MRTAFLKRTSTGDAGTFGTLYLDSNTTFATLELPYRDTDQDGKSDPQFSCIPPGVYRCQWVRSPRLGYHRYRLLDVPGRHGILIHAGNHAGDTKKGLRSDAFGCILLGTKPAKVLGQDGIEGSRSAVAAFEKDLDQEDFELTIVEAFT